MTMRRLQFSVLAGFLALLLLTRLVLPSPMLWQCHHAAQIVTAPFTARPDAMPCRMASLPAGPMLCCQHERITRSAVTATRPVVSRPACHPTLTPLAALSTATATEAQARSHFLPAFPALSLFPSALPVVPITLSARQRPPPALGLSLSAPCRVPGLRAPPAA